MIPNDSSESAEIDEVLYLQKLEGVIIEKKLSNKHMKTFLHVLFELVRIICGKELLEQGEEDLCAALLVDKTTVAYQELEKFIQENYLEINEEREEMSHSNILKNVLDILENTRSVEEFPTVDISQKRNMRYVKGGYKAEVRNLIRTIEAMIKPKLNIFHRDDTDTLFDLVHHFCGVDLTKEFPYSRIWTTPAFNHEEFRRQKSVAAFGRLEKFIKEYRLIEKIPKKRRLGRAKILRILIFYLKKQQNPALKIDENTMSIVPDRNQEQLSELLQTLNNNICNQPLVSNNDFAQVILPANKNPFNLPLEAFTAIPNLLNNFNCPTNPIFQSNALTQTLLTQAQMNLQPFLISLLPNIFPQPPISLFPTMISLMNPGLVPAFPNSPGFPDMSLFSNVVIPNLPI
ncbi:hypothetical protein CAEBREN_05424 [Caenorhabditis brenneri]|uniref:Uncharacterized protein n=1 Tax=Caenorhabditis brenneri TaxID=135651 RepID=G0N1Z3_CAEBE|nr:hypothetical protein CAEBREN_05424 [Caenorhabditis brenneri]